MSQSAKPTVLLFGALLVSRLQAAEPQPFYFEHKDWEVACDNTRTCRAAAYQEDGAEVGVSILLTRAAGPNQAPRIQLQLGQNSPAFPRTVQMRVGGRPLGAVTLGSEPKGELNAAQTSALLAAVRKDDAVSWHAKSAEWVLSTKGANAVLLKMDEFQGRLDTPGALIRKGSKPESSVAPALPAPEVIAAPIASDEADPKLVPGKQRPALLAALRSTLGAKNENSCERFEENARDPNKLSVYRLSDRHLLVSMACWMAAYNSGDAYWLVNAQPPYAPVLVTNLGSEYGSGEIHAIQKGRGFGDCMGSETWTWDGRHFVHTSAFTTGMCKDISPGGAWELPTVVARVKPAK